MTRRTRRCMRHGRLTLLSRRVMLRLLVAGASGLLFGCSRSSSPSPAAPTTLAQTAVPAAQPLATQPARPAAEARTVDARSAAAARAQSGPAASKKLGGVLRLHMRAGNEQDTLDEVLPRFMQETGVAVKLETIAPTEYFTKLQTIIGGGTVGDVWWCAQRNTPRFANNKVIMPVDKLIEADNFDLSEYYPAAIEATRYHGVMYALPFKLNPGPSVLFYNANHVQKAGLTMPTKQFASWDELIALARPLLKESGGRVERWPFYLPLTTATTNTLQAVTMYFRSWGGDVYTEDGTKALFNEPPVRAAIRFMSDLIHKHKIAAPGQEITQTFEELMIAQKVSMLQANSSTKSITTKIGGKFEVKNLLMPPGPTGKLGTQALPDMIVINAKTQNPEAAWELVKLLCGKEAGVRLGGGTGGSASGTCGARRDVFADPRLMASPLHPAFVDLAEQTLPIRFPANLREEEVAAAVHQTLMPIWLGERQPDDTFFIQLNAAVQDVLDRPIA